MRYNVTGINSGSMMAGDSFHHSFINLHWTEHHKEFYLPFCTHFLIAVVVEYLFILPLFQYWVYLKVINSVYVTVVA
jgi:hypothetical protein